MEKKPTGSNTFFCIYCHQNFPFTSKEYHDLNCYYKQISNVNRSTPLPLYPFSEERENKQMHFNVPHLNNNQNNEIYHPVVNSMEYPSIEEINSHINDDNLIPQYPDLENSNENNSQHQLLDEFVDITSEVENIKIEEEKERLEKIQNEIEKKEKAMSVLKRVGKIGAGVGLFGLAIFGRSLTLARAGAYLIAEGAEDEDENEVHEQEQENNNYEQKKESIEEIIDLLPKTAIKNESSRPKKECIICLSAYQINDEITALPCTHIFHNSCIVSWLKQNQTCPLCKYKITKEHFYP